MRSDEEGNAAQYNNPIHHSYGFGVPGSLVSKVCELLSGIAQVAAQIVPHKVESSDAPTGEIVQTPESVPCGG